MGSLRVLEECEGGIRTETYLRGAQSFRTTFSVALWSAMNVPFNLSANEVVK